MKFDDALDHLVPWPGCDVTATGPSPGLIGVQGGESPSRVAIRPAAMLGRYRVRFVHPGAAFDCGLFDGIPQKLLRRAVVKFAGDPDAFAWEARDCEPILDDDFGPWFLKRFCTGQTPIEAGWIDHAKTSRGTRRS